jgi:hypothetical protein
MKRFFCAALLVGLLCTSAQANPILTATVTNLGGGVYAWDISIDPQDANLGSFFVDGSKANTGFVFNGNIQQIKAFAAVTVDKQADANTYNGLFPASGYQSQTDSWFYDPWASNFQGIGAVEGAGSYKVVAGTGSGSKLNTVPFAHIVTTGPYPGNVALTYSGQVGRDPDGSGPLSPVYYPVSGQFLVPEPSTCVLALFGFGSLLLARWKRRRLR